MIKKIWRYSHLFLAVFSSLFLLIATITGVILAFEPIQTQLNYAPNSSLNDVSLSEILPQVKANYDEVFELKRTDDDLIVLSALNIEKDFDGEFLIDLQTAEVVQEVPKQSEFFEFVTTLHRSLFMKNTGRWLVGVNAFFLLLIAISGMVLIAKRQNNWRHFFDRIVRLDFPSYSHTFLGRWMLIPLAVIALSAVILFLVRFEYLPDNQVEMQEIEVNSKLENMDIKDFEIFRETDLSQLKSLEFPFSEFEEDYFILKTDAYVFHIHQYTGQVLAQQSLSRYETLYDLNLFLHTGKGNIWWAIILGLSGLSIFYFMFSGAQMALPRLKRKTKNKIQPDEAEIVILYGSETGSTQHFAELFFQSLIKNNKKAYFTTLNNYQCFPKMKQLVVMTATYGKGEPPHNAFYFEKKWNQFSNPQDVEYAIVGFGSSQYPDFCAFAKSVDQKFMSTPNFHENLGLKLIDERSITELRSWWKDWNVANDMTTQIPDKLTDDHDLQSFKILSKNRVEDGFGTTFLLKIQSKKNLKFASGDLLGVFPPNEKVERFYSIGKIEKNQLLLSIKLHDQGICSQYLNSLKESESFEAYIKSNPSFHLPLKARSITFISNGTGIAPYLGMVNDFVGKKYFYWGGRKVESWNLYKDLIRPQTFEAFELVFSRENTKDKYIQDLIQSRKPEIFDRLKNEGVLMFCGSMQMQEDVFAILDAFALENNLPTMESWIQQGQILVDTY